MRTLSYRFVLLYTVTTDIRLTWRNMLKLVGACSKYVKYDTAFVIGPMTKVVLQLPKQDNRQAH